ncbi:poly(ADP-ribose) glycohydrolase [Salminus brasiliensis]|uniref:poly(ADP-ribose) glycohydrolase n=1 Tax=Salminus brasiliensis TaxID=930266 RepID=UPI003B82F8A4
MTRRNDSSQMKKCLTHQSPGDSSNKADSKVADQKGADSKKAGLGGADSTGADSKKAGLCGADSTGADLIAMGSNEGCLSKPNSTASVLDNVGVNTSDSNKANSSGATSSGASSKEQSSKCKHSQSSYGEATDLGPSSNSGDKLGNLKMLKREPECHMELDTLRPRQNHTVLIDTTKFNDNLLIPHEGKHAWDNNHVKLLPHFPKNEPLSRWQVTEKALQGLIRGSASVKDVEMAIMSYNRAYKKEWTFNALNSYVQQVNKHENNFSTVISKMARLALQLQDQIKHAIPLLKQKHSHAITLSQVQISCLLANAFFCTFPHRNTTKPDSEYASYPTINFSNLFGDSSMRKIQKLRALFHYFNTVTDNETRPDGLVTFERICIPPSQLPCWKTQLETLTDLQVFSEGCIEKEGKGMLQVDFASKYIGGGVLGNGLVQEEILFLLSPELIVARLFTEKLGDNECLKITGTQTYNTISGYSNSFEWQGPYTDNTKRDKWKRRFCQIVAIDALHFRDFREQYTETNVMRELNKAYVGFRRDPSVPLEYTPAIATGNWGCGAFNGDPQLKALIQMMAAAVAKRDMAFFTFGHKGQAQELQKMHHLLKTNKVSVAHLYSLLKNYCDDYNRHKSKSVFDYIKHQTPSSQL